MSQTSKLAVHRQMIVEEGWQTALAITAQRGLNPSTAYTWHSRHRQLCLLACRRDPSERQTGAFDFCSLHVKSRALGLVQHDCGAG